MIRAKGICGTCGQACHLTKHYGWQHDKPNKEADKEHFALTEPNINEVAAVNNRRLNFNEYNAMRSQNKLH